MNKVIIMNDRERSILSRVRKAAAKRGISPDKVQPSYLRVGVLLDASKNEYQFQIRKDVGGSLLHDRKLDQNDSFVIAKLGFYLLREEPAQPGSGLLQSYPNNIVFPAVAGEVTPAHLNAFYNGSYRFKVEDREYSEAIPTKGMLSIRTTQQSAAGNFSEMLGDDGLIDLTPDITLDGSRKNEVALRYPSFPGMQIQQVAATIRLYGTFYAKGFLVVGGSNLGNL